MPPRTPNLDYPEKNSIMYLAAGIGRDYNGTAEYHKIEDNDSKQFVIEGTKSQSSKDLAECETNVETPCGALESLVLVDGTMSEELKGKEISQASQLNKVVTSHREIQIEVTRKVLTLEENFLRHVEGPREKYWCSLCSCECYFVSVVFHALSKKHLNLHWVKRHTLQEMENKLHALELLTTTTNIFQRVLSKAVYRINSLLQQEKKDLKLTPKVESTVSFSNGNCNQENALMESIVINGSSFMSLQEQFHKTVSDKDRNNCVVECGTCGAIFQIFNDDIDLSLDMHIQNDPQHSLAMAQPLVRDAQNVSEMCKSSSSKLVVLKSSRFIQSGSSQGSLATQCKTDNTSEQEDKIISEALVTNSHSSKSLGQHKSNSGDYDSDKAKVIKEILHMEKMNVVTDGNTHCCKLCSVAFQSDSQIVHHLLGLRHLSDKWASQHTLEIHQEKLEIVQSLSHLTYGKDALKNALRQIKVLIATQRNFEYEEQVLGVEPRSSIVSKDSIDKLISNMDEDAKQVAHGKDSVLNGSQTLNSCKLFFCNVCMLLLNMGDKEMHLEGQVHNSMVKLVSVNNMI